MREGLVTVFKRATEEESSFPVFLKEHGFLQVLYLEVSAVGRDVCAERRPIETAGVER